MSSANSTDNNKKADQITPGLLLRAKRENLEMKLEEVAKNIHLEKKIIEAIEADDYENLPAAIYVRGYLRTYAKIVGADAEHIINLYNTDTPSEEPEILPEVKPPTQASSSDKPVKAFTYLISLGLVLLFLFWYQSNFVVDKKRVQDQQETNTTPAVINGVDTSYQVVAHPEGWRSPIIAEDDAIETSNKEIDTMEIQIESIDGSTELLPIENVLTEQVGAIGKDSLVLKLTRDSWIEVYGANDEQLFHDLGIAGEEYKIFGTTPFNVLLGYSNGVVVEFNGKSFDQTPYSSNGIARFTLPVQ